MSLTLKPKSECAFDQISMGEVMLRLDPGEGRIRTARNFAVWEGGGEYNTSRGLRKCFGYSEHRAIDRQRVHVQLSTRPGECASTERQFDVSGRHTDSDTGRCAVGDQYRLYHPRQQLLHVQCHHHQQHRRRLLWHHFGRLDRNASRQQQCHAIQHNRHARSCHPCHYQSCISIWRGW